MQDGLPCNKTKQYMSLVLEKADLSICKNKEAYQLCGNREGDHRLCFRYTDSTIPLLAKSEVSSLLIAFFNGCTAGIVSTWSKNPSRCGTYDPFCIYALPVSHISHSILKCKQAQSSLKQPGFRIAKCCLMEVSHFQRTVYS